MTADDLTRIASVDQLRVRKGEMNMTKAMWTAAAKAASGYGLSGANCKLMNDKGTWFIVTPGSTTVNRSYNDLRMTCTKEGHEEGVTTAKSSTKAMAAGNILSGGVVGAAVDAGTGAANDYPSLIHVFMGRSVVLC